VTSGPIIIGSERSEAGLPAAMELLRQGASALDAVEAALRLCEDNLADHYVGTGGLPNARGEVELDASIMVGSTRAFGAVGAVRNFPHPISSLEPSSRSCPSTVSWSAKAPNSSPRSRASNRRLFSRTRPGSCFVTRFDPRAKPSRARRRWPRLATTSTASRPSNWSIAFVPTRDVGDHQRPRS